MALGDWAEKHWRWLVLLFWLLVSAYMLWDRWDAIRLFALGDTDDNLRMMQVRGLIAGQGWFDLRQYRLDPPYGADIHWSRLVDLPIAAIKLILGPLIGGRDAEQAAVAIAPLLPLLVAMTAVAVTVRRLIGGGAFAIAVALLVCGGSARGMWAPLRIDHHGWQLAMLAVAVMALTDSRRARGGVVAGVATALSLAIGLEMLLYLALVGAAIGLRWLHDAGQAKRLFAYGVSLAGGCALAFALFSSNANRAAVCDALSPVWLSTMLAAGVAAVVLAWINPRQWGWRLAVAALAGGLVALAFILLWPDCLGRLERSSPELERLWLSRVREAMPVYGHGFNTAIQIVTLPIAGLIGYALMLWTHRRDAAKLIPWASVAALALLAAALLLWQTRAGPAAQLLSVAGATALAWAAIEWLRAQRSMIVRVVGIVGAFLVVSGIAAGYLATLNAEPPSAYRQSVNLANWRCSTIRDLRPVAQQPRGNVLTFIDLGPRLITVTPHNAVAGPYHRNGRQILDVMRAWRGNPANARATVDRYRIDYVLICPNMSESTIYRSEAPQGFYAQLAAGRAPAWLRRVSLPEGSPFRMYRVVR
ncbi:MAG: AcrB/AcrD/AcrF family protein [Sphingomonas sp.]